MNIIHIYSWIYMYTYICEQRLNTYTHTHICLSWGGHIYIYVHMCMYIYISIYIAITYISPTCFVSVVETYLVYFSFIYFTSLVKFQFISEVHFEHCSTSNFLSPLIYFLSFHVLTLYSMFILNIHYLFCLLFIIYFLKFNVNLTKKKI